MTRRLPPLLLAHALIATLLGVVAAPAIGANGAGCAKLTDDRARLACYDEAFGTAGAQVTNAPAATAPIQQSPPLPPQMSSPGASAAAVIS